MTPARPLAGADHPRRLGAGRAGAGQRDLARRDAGLRPPLGASSRTPSSPPRAATSACPTGRWATPRSATSTSAPARSSSRTWPGSTTPIADGSFFENEALLAACERARSSPRGRLHLLGLVSDGGVHSGWEHIEATIELASQEGVPDVVFHAFTDGRDTLPHGGRGYLDELERWLRQAGRVATVSGRYYAMDRDTRWERTKLAYDAIVHAQGLRAPSSAAAIEASYERGETDEFVKPTVIGDYDGAAEGDVAIFVNFRPDRARQMTRALAEPGFDEFPRGGAPTLDLTTMTEYRKGWPYPVAFPEQRPQTTLAETIAERGRPPAARRRDREVRPRHLLLQRRPRAGAGGGRARPGRLPARRPDLRPQAGDERRGRRRGLRRATGARASYRFGIINFANPDMVGHTGVIPAAVKAVETVDAQLGEVVEAVDAPRAAPASSPPTTATATTCSSPTAPPTPPTRSTRCR